VFIDSPPIAGILLFWLVISWLASHPLLGRAGRTAGLVMAVTYAIVRGVAIAKQVQWEPTLADVGTVLRVNGLALLAAVGWFLVARLVIFGGQVWSELGLPGVFTSPADGLAFVFTATGVVTIVMYAVALGTAGLRGESPPKQRETAPDGSPADD
jgi:hypothetical protein